MSTNDSVFNTDLEAGLRAAIFLDAFYPSQANFDTLLKVDHVIVNSKDFGGPDSIHPPIPNRNAEYVVRRGLVRSGIDLMLRFGLIERQFNNDGIYYFATEYAHPYLKLMRTDYNQKLIQTAKWLSGEIKNNSTKLIDMKLSSMVF